MVNTLKLDLLPIKHGLGGGDCGTGGLLAIISCVTSGFRRRWAGGSGQLASCQNKLFGPASFQNDQLGFLPDFFHLSIIPLYSRHSPKVEVKHFAREA